MDQMRDDPGGAEPSEELNRQSEVQDGPQRNTDMSETEMSVQRKRGGDPGSAGPQL